MKVPTRTTGRLIIPSSNKRTQDSQKIKFLTDIFNTQSVELVELLCRSQQAWTSWHKASKFGMQVYFDYYQIDISNSLFSSLLLSSYFIAVRQFVTVPTLSCTCLFPFRQSVLPTRLAMRFLIPATTICIAVSSSLCQAKQFRFNGLWTVHALHCALVK